MRMRSVAIAVAACGVCSLAAAAPAEAPRALGLGEVVAATLAGNTELALAHVAVAQAQGAALAAGEPFDVAVASAVARDRRHQFGLDPTRDPRHGSRLEEASLELGVSKRFGLGFEVGPHARVSRTEIADLGIVQGEASARLRLVVPLLRDRGYRVTGAAERAARGEHAATLLDEEHALAEAALRAAAAYWQYLAARRRLEVLASSEERALRTVAETGTLLEAQERTRADLEQARGQAAQRRAARITGERELLAAHAQLAAVMGHTASDLATLPAAATDFPAAGPEPTPAALARWLADLVARRPDLRAAAHRVSTAFRQLHDARNELAPRLDLELAGGYLGRTIEAPGQTPDRTSWRRFFSPLGGDMAGPDVFAALRLELPITHAGPRGRVAQSAALHDQQRLALAARERDVRSGVRTAFETVRRSRLGLQDAEQAVTLLGRGVDTEKRRFQLGNATLFEVIFAEDLLTTAMLERIEGQRSHAVALAELRFQTGTLVPDANPADAATVAAITHNLVSLP